MPGLPLRAPALGTVLKSGAAAGRSLLRSSAIPVGIGLVAVYAYGTAKYRRNAKTTYEFGALPAPGGKGFNRLLSTVSGAAVSSGNRVEVLRNGAGTFPAMLGAIASASATIDFSSYIYWPGEVASTFTDALAERARAGVEVNVVLDGWGSANASVKVEATSPGQ